MNKFTNVSLKCGDVGGGTTFSKYVAQRVINPTIDCGLDVIFQPQDNGLLNFSFTSNAISMVFEPFQENANAYNIILDEVGDAPRNISAEPFTLNSYWGYSGTNQIIKGAYQAYTQIIRDGKVGTDWYWGIRYMDDATANNTDPVVAGFHRKGDGTCELVDTNILTGLSVAVPIPYVIAEGDFLVCYTAEGQLQFQAYAGDPNTQDGVLDVGALKFDSISVLPKGFNIYSALLGDDNVNFRHVLSKGISETTIDNPNDTPFFRMLWSADRLTVPNGVNRTITMDFTNAGDLSQQLGFTTQILVSPVPQQNTSFTGVQTAVSSRVQDIALYWSLPAHTYVASQDGSKNSRENMIASFTPSRQLNTTSNLFFQEEIAYTDIGNLQTMNISTIQFRVINLYSKFNSPLKTNYLSFVLFIKEEF